jgi:predicted RNA-binding protein YlqC (UPF0109 family)
VTNLYEAGDINTTDDDVDDYDEGNEADDLNDVDEGNEVTDPDAVVIDTEERRGGLKLSLHVAPDDMGRVIGRRGRTAQAIRTLVNVAGAKDGISASVDIVDD